MKLIWTLLRQHISKGQLAGFFFANLVGLLIVLLSVQFYQDLAPALTADDGFLGNDYIVISKKVGALGGSTSFTKEEVKDIESQSFCKSLGSFTASKYQVYCSVGMNGINMGTDMFFESVPDAFVDIKSDSWNWQEGSDLPIILPKSYLTIYNFGFAQSRSLPQMGEGIAGMMELNIILSGNGLREQIPARIVVFSSRLNTILVPESFIKWSNHRYAPNAIDNASRLIAEVANPADERIAQYMKSKGYELADDKMQMGKTMFFLKVCSTVVILVGALISLLSFYILMLSVFLLLEKNTDKLRNLILIGYSSRIVALPYQLLTVSLNGMVLILAVVLLLTLRHYYLELLWTMFPQMNEGSLVPAIVCGIVVWIMISTVNVLVIFNKVNRIWKIS